MINMIHRADHVEEWPHQDVDSVKFVNAFVDSNFGRKSANSRGSLDGRIRITCRTATKHLLTVGGSISISLSRITVGMADWGLVKEIVYSSLGLEPSALIHPSLPRL